MLSLEIRALRLEIRPFRLEIGDGAQRCAGFAPALRREVGTNFVTSRNWSILGEEGVMVEEREFGREVAARWPLTCQIGGPDPGHIHVAGVSPSWSMGDEPYRAWCRLCGMPICRSLDPDGTVSCTKSAGHEGEHENEWNGVKWGGGA